MKLSILFLIITFLTPLCSYGAENLPVEEKEAFQFLPQEEFFAPLIAAQREPQFSARYNRYNPDGRDDFNGAAVSLGEAIPVFQYDLEEDSAWQFGIEGGVFSLFNMDEHSNDLINSDFIYGFSAIYKNENYLNRLRLYHSSSHLGDEFILANPDTRRSNTSYETLESISAYYYKDFRFYGGPGVVVRSEEVDNRFSAQWGVEYRKDIGKKAQFIFAGDFLSAGRRSWTVNQSYRMGFAFPGPGSKEVRLVAEFAKGFWPEGEFAEERTTIFGAGFYISL
jgi:Protein of unknown function (DUF1207)